MRNFKRLNKIGLLSILGGIAIFLVLVVCLELKYLLQGSPLFYLMASIANAGLFLFIAIGLYFWFYYYKVFGSKLNPVGLCFYLGFSAISGYWAYANYKNQNI